MNSEGCMITFEKCMINDETLMTGRMIHPCLMNTCCCCCCCCCCWWWSVDLQLAATKAPLGLWCLLSRSDHLSYGRWYCQGLPCTLEFDGQVAPKLKGWKGRISPQTCLTDFRIQELYPCWSPMNRHLTNPSVPHRIWKGSFGFGEIPRKMAKQVFRGWRNLLYNYSPPEDYHFFWIAAVRSSR